MANTISANTNKADEYRTLIKTNPLEAMSQAIDLLLIPSNLTADQFAMAEVMIGHITATANKLRLLDKIGGQIDN